MRILVIDEEVPCPLNSGKRIRTFNLLQNLAANHQIIFLCRQHEGIENDAEMLKESGMELVIVPHPIRRKGGIQFYFALLANLFSRYPYSVASHYSGMMVKRAVELHEKYKFDLVHCEWTPYAINLKPLLSLPSVVDAHNIEAMIWHRNFLVEKNILKKTFIYLQWKKMNQFEKNYFPLFTRSVAVSKQDAATVADWVPPEQVDVVANGVDVEFFSSKRIPKVRNSLVFTGSLDWRPNVDGLIDFLDTTFPLIRKRVPDCRFVIVGRNPMQVLKNKVRELEGVELTGTVDDVRPHMDTAAVYVVPLRVGGGSRLKILEAFAMEQAVVSTTVGAEGLEIKNEKHMLLADTPETFTDAVLKLFGDRELASTLGKAGRRLVEEQYQWKVLADRLEQNWFQAATEHKNI